MQHRVSRWTAIVLGGGALAALSACSSSSTTPKSSPPPAVSTTAAPSPATPEPKAARANPNIVEETATYYVERFRKSDMVRVDEKRIRYPFAAAPLPIYREDADYYYIRTEKVTPEERRAVVLQRQKAAVEEKAAAIAKVEADAKKNPLLVTPEQFESLTPEKASVSVSFRRAGEGLPKRGQWRQNIAVADIDGDGHLDVVTTPPRLSGSTQIHLYLGDGHGNFRPQAVETLDASGKAVDPKLPYGGIAAGDLDGDGRPDLVVASHAGTVKAFRNLGGGKFEIRSEGLPATLSSQAVTLADVDGDGRLDIVVSQDMVNNTIRQKTGTDPSQVRVYRNEGRWKWRPDRKGSPEGACFSFNLFPIDVSGHGKRDILTGCRAWGGWGLTWKNDGKGNFSNELFTNIEQGAYHFAVAPGSFGADHRTAFADLYSKSVGLKGIGTLIAGGLNVYYQDGAGWHTVAVWRQKGFRGRLTSVAMGDLDGDGLDDIVFPDRTANRVRIFFQTAEGQFRESREDAEPALDSPVADTRLADIDGDGRLDIVLSKTVDSENPRDPGGIEVLLNQGR